MFASNLKAFNEEVPCSASIAHKYRLLSKKKVVTNRLAYSSNGVRSEKRKFLTTSTPDRRVGATADGEEGLQRHFPEFGRPGQDFFKSFFKNIFLNYLSLAAAVACAINVLRS